ncbi:MAG: hypothetical protein CVU38_00300 [Chloroflexi bacterium HGW-Chloroflexi-1]|nr:MAG: hypothetical protein CVU38_00300 [Chloroflexi bacterium HGW-Chloroflexi-1]
MRVLVFSERLAPPPDEGIKNLALSLAAALRRKGHAVLALTTDGADWPEQQVTNQPAGRLLWSRPLAQRIARFRPQAVCYVPTASLTVASAIRSRVLKHHANGAPVALIATQGRRHSPFARWVGRLIRPDLCVVQSLTTEMQACALGWRVVRVLPGVDADAFHPVSPQQRAVLRAQHGIPADAWVVVHVGHLNRRRGVAALAALADLAYPVLVASTSTPQDAALADELRAAGVYLVTAYLPDVREAYQLADAYLFPTPPDPTEPGSIDLPLSVLEAAACNLPILATRFGALPDLWPDRPDVIFYDDVPGLRAGLMRLKAAHPATRDLALPFSWEAAGQRILDALPPASRS